MLNLFALELGSISERGTNRVIVSNLEYGDYVNSAKIRLFLKDGKNKELIYSSRTFQIEKKNEKKDIKSESKKIACCDLWKRSKKVQEFNEDIFSFFISGLEMGAIFFYPITSLPAQAINSLRFIYTTPRDLLDKNHQVQQKIKRMINGKHIKANKTKFNKILNLVSNR